MKKITVLIIIAIISVTAFSQVKVRFSLANPHIDQGKLIYDLKATVPTQQVWRVGPSCVRIGYTTDPDTAYKLIEDNPATNANLNIHNNLSYGNISTTSIMHEAAASFNILKLLNGACYYFTEGSYTLGSLRWNVIDSSGCIDIEFLTISTPFDSMNTLAYGAQWEKIDTSWCNLIGINVHLIGKVPTQYMLHQNYPNPFNPVTKIKYDIPKSSDVQLRIFDAAGREVELAVSDRLEPGSYEFIWNSGSYSSGVYFYTLTVSGENPYKETKKMVLIK